VILLLIVLGLLLAVVDQFTGRHLAKMGTLRLTCVVAVVVAACVMWK
jgi:hypothetical protein